jgi:hypothetical protein
VYTLPLKHMPSPLDSHVRTLSPAQPVRAAPAVISAQPRPSSSLCCLFSSSVYFLPVTDFTTFLVFLFSSAMVFVLA